MLATTRLIRVANKPQPSQHLLGKPKSHSRLNESRPWTYHLSYYRAFGTTISKGKETSPPSGNNQKAKQTPNDHVLPTLNLKELIGANRKVYYFVLAVLSILGTMETIFWCKVIYAKFFAPDEDRETTKEDR